MSGLVWDPLRRKEVTATPEEKVRQWFILQLRDVFKVPPHMMMSEVGFVFGEKQYRADIIVYDRSGSPLMVVECKRPSVELTQQVAEQALRYNSVLNVRFLALTNGKKTYLYRRNSGEFVPLETIVLYNDMCSPSVL